MTTWLKPNHCASRNAKKILLLLDSSFSLKPPIEDLETDIICSWLAVLPQHAWYNIIPSLHIYNLPKKATRLIIENLKDHHLLVNYTSEQTRKSIGELPQRVVKASMEWDEFGSYIQTILNDPNTIYCWVEWQLRRGYDKHASWIETRLLDILEKFLPEEPVSSEAPPPSGSMIILAHDIVTEFIVDRDLSKALGRLNAAISKSDLKSKIKQLEAFLCRPFDQFKINYLISPTKTECLTISGFEAFNVTSCFGTSHYSHMVAELEVITTMNETRSMSIIILDRNSNQAMLMNSMLLDLADLVSAKNFMMKHTGPQGLPILPLRGNFALIPVQAKPMSWYMRDEIVCSQDTLTLGEEFARNLGYDCVVRYLFGSKKMDEVWMDIYKGTVMSNWGLWEPQESDDDDNSNFQIDKNSQRILGGLGILGHLPAAMAVLSEALVDQKREPYFKAALISHYRDRNYLRLREKLESLTTNREIPSRTNKIFYLIDKSRLL